MEDSVANTYPYISSPGALVKAVDQFRRSFPNTVDAAYLKRMGLAPGNESYLINVLRFLGLIDESGAKNDDAANAFFGSDEHFKTGFSDLVSKAYAPVFTELGSDAWIQSRDVLAHWFRMVDKTTDLIGQRQAGTFLTLAGITGHGRPNETKSPTKPAQKPSPVSKTAANRKSSADSQTVDHTQTRKDAASNESRGATDDVDDSIALSVKIEINVPVGATPEEYDAMFSSIRKHLYPA